MWGRHVDQRNRLRRQPVRRKTTEHVNPMLLVYDVRHRFVERLSGIAVPNACHGIRSGIRVRRSTEFCLLSNTGNCAAVSINVG